MNGAIIGIACYLVIGVAVSIVGEFLSGRLEGDDEPGTFLGYLLIAVAWPIMLAQITLEWWRDRRGQ